MSMKDFIGTLSEEQKKALIDALMSTDNNSTKQETQDNDNKPSLRNDFTVDPKKSNNRRREPVRARKNEWVDTGEFKDIETEYGEKTPRNRKPPKKVDVECSVCGRSFKADSRYIYGEYHRCNKCVGR